MTFWQVLGLGVVGLFAVYLVVRIATFAYFKTRDDFNRGAKHGTQRR